MDNLTIREKPVRIYTLTETVFAWISLLIGYLFLRVIPVSENTLGGFLFIVLLYTVTFIVLKFKGIKFKALPIVAAISAVAISASLILCSNKLLCFFAYIYALATYCYFVYASNGNAIKNGFNDLILADYLKALVLLPFSSFEQIFKALFSGKSNKSGKFILKVFIGVFIAIIPTVIVIGLLSYDSAFSELLSKIFDFDIGNIISHILSFIFGIPVGMYVFGLFVSSIDNKCKDDINLKTCNELSQKTKIAPVVTVLVAVIPLLFVYVIFFISQWQYYISGFTGVLPENFSYAQYAREGFFQLCIVSVINLIVILSAVLFTKRNYTSANMILKILAIVYSLFTLILISTAIAKMIMYIDYYGLTQKRVYATWFMGILAVIFILVTVRQFVTKLNAVALSLAVSVVLFGALSLSGVDSLIARYNVNRYINGSLEIVDIAAMDELGDAAVPELVRLSTVLEEKEELNKKEKQMYFELTDTLNNEKYRIEETGEDEGFFSFNIPSAKANKAMEGWNKQKKD